MDKPMTPIADRRGNATMVPWVKTTRFSILDAYPDRDLCCSYSLEGSDWPIEEQGFTARAECDFDADGKLSMWTITDKSTDVMHSGDDR